MVTCKGAAIQSPVHVEARRRWVGMDVSSPPMREPELYTHACVRTHTHTHEPGSFTGLFKRIPTARTLAQANLVGKLPNRSPWGVFIPAGDLLHCAFSGPFYPHSTPIPGSPSLRLERTFSVSSMSEDKQLAPPQAFQADPDTDPCVCVHPFSSGSSGLAPSTTAQAASVLHTPLLPDLPFWTKN